MTVKTGTNKKHSHAFCTKKVEKRPGGYFSDQYNIAYYKLQDTELLSQFNDFSLNKQNCWEVLLNTTYWEKWYPYHRESCSWLFHISLAKVAAYFGIILMNKASLANLRTQWIHFHEVCFWYLLGRSGKKSYV